MWQSAVHSPALPLELNARWLCAFWIGLDCLLRKEVRHGRVSAHIKHRSVNAVLVLSPASTGNELHSLKACVPEVCGHLTKVQYVLQHILYQ